MRMGQGVRTGLGHGGITCVLQRQFSSFVFNFPKVYLSYMSMISGEATCPVSFLPFLQMWTNS